MDTDVGEYVKPIPSGSGRAASLAGISTDLSSKETLPGWAESYYVYQNYLEEERAREQSRPKSTASEDPYKEWDSREEEENSVFREYP